jgi:Chalcone isomerase-like
MPFRFTRFLCRGLATALLLFAALHAPAAQIAEQQFDDRARIADTELMLNGLGVRAVLMFKGYAAGLYLPAKVRSTAQVLAQHGAKRIQLRMLIDVPAKEFVKAIAVGMKRNHSEVEHLALKERIDRFADEVQGLGTVKKGDVVDLDFVPASGLQLSVNGAPRGEPIPGADLYAGVLKIFIGDLPVDKKLKAGLLGSPPP